MTIPTRQTYPPVSGTSWAVITTKGIRRVVLVTPTASPADTQLTESPQAPETSQPSGPNVLEHPQRSETYSCIGCPQAPGWQMLDRLLAETRWLQKRISLGKRGSVGIRPLR